MIQALARQNDFFFVPLKISAIKRRSCPQNSALHFAWRTRSPKQAASSYSWSNSCQMRGQAELPKDSAAGCNGLTSHMMRKTSAAKIILGWTTGTRDG